VNDGVAVPTPLPGMQGAIDPLAEAQIRSAQAKRIFEASDAAEPWLDDYFTLVAEGWSWRQAVYLIWAALPPGQRSPRTQEALATEVLGLTSDRQIWEWNQNPAIEARRARLVRSVIKKSLPEVYEALIESAKKANPRSHSDRRLLLEMAGEYTPKQTLTVGPERADESEMSEEELRKLKSGPGGGSG
jgi:hypothetical protein